MDYIKSDNKIYELFTRLSIKHKIIGVPKIDEKTFNLYLNTCTYCEGSFSKEIYNQDLLIVDKTKSILDN